MQEKKVPAAEPADWERALEGLEFPAAKVAILRHVEDTGGLDHEVIEVLGRLPKHEYTTLDELTEDARGLYIQDGFDAANLPV
jgi:hypothetical protein